EGTPFRFLPTPAEAVPQQRPDADWAVAHAEPLANHLTDPLQRPQLGPVPCCLGATEKHALQLLLLSGRQAAGATRNRPGPQSVPPIAAVRLVPAGHRTQRCPDLPRDLPVRHSSLQERDRMSAAPLQLLAGPEWSHANHRSRAHAGRMHYLLNAQ